LRYILIGSTITALATILSAQNASAQPAGEEISEVQSNEKDKKPRARKADGDAFVLGRIDVYGDRQAGGTSGQAVSQSVVSAEDVRGQNRNTLDDALRTVPGVESSNSGGQRNERMVYVRGFDRWRVPLSIDGVRIYLPADNRLDYGRFLTPDLAEIQVHKGYASVLNGPGGMGGQINLVTRKPS
jgi:iron complex outermembrane receptor protein